jgi:hypothetical protein
MHGDLMVWPMVMVVNDYLMIIYVDQWLLLVVNG